MTQALSLLTLGLTGLLCVGAVPANAAEPSAPERLAAQAAGVVGSGDQLSLRVMQDGKERSVKVGDDYADGWKLDALTPTSATLVKGGQRREVGLNPTGALAGAQPAAPPSQVRVTLSDAEMLDQAIKGGLWDGKTPRPGLTLAQTQRYALLTQRAILGSVFYSMDTDKRSMDAGLGHISMKAGGETVFAALLGATEGAEYIALLKEERANKVGLAQALYDRYGPVEVTMSLAFDKDQYAKRDADYPGAAWTSRPSLDATTQVMALAPPDPQATDLIPDEVPSLDEAARILRPGGDETKKSDWLSATEYFAQH